MIRLAFRLDDPSQTSDHALEQGILDCFRGTAIPLTCAVVPFHCDGEAEHALTADVAAHLVEALREGIIEVALHGFCHRQLALLPDGNSTEFSGIDPARQRDALTRGMATIEEVFSLPPTGFVPPWNSYDQATPRLLGELGFRYLSADWALVGNDTPPIAVIPHTCNLTHLQEAITEARQFPGLDPVITVILHHFDFTESGNADAGTDLAELKSLLSRVSNQPDIHCKTLAELAAELAPDRCMRNLHLARWRGGLHWRLQRLLPHYVMLDADRGALTAALGKAALLRLPRAFRA